MRWRWMLNSAKTLAWVTALVWWFAMGSAAAEALWTEKSAAKGSAQALQDDLFSKMAEELGPAVVNIRILQKTEHIQYPDFFGQTPGRNAPNAPGGDYRESGEGSGFIIHKDGYILSNAHVVANSDAIQVALADGKLFRGKVIGFDAMTDISLIKIEAPSPLPVLPLGDSDRLKTGEWVMAIGSPFGLEQTVTVGIVSGKGRSLGASPFDDYIQTDASINPGNSGGPLINTHGEVIGINTAILAEGQNLGFSIPINLVKKLVPQLKATGRVVRSWLGVTVQDITLALKEKHRLEVDSGSLVSSVVPNGPAAKAGIQSGDVIIEFDRAPIKNSRELPTRVAHTPAGSRVTVTVVRGGKRLSIELTLEKMPGRT